MSTLFLCYINNALFKLYLCKFFFSPEVDLKLIKAGGDDSVQYEAVVGLDLGKDDKGQSDDESDNVDSEEGEAEEENGKVFVSSRRPKHEDKEEKKLRKQAQKELNAEKRKDKVKKHVKKRASRSNKK